MALELPLLPEHLCDRHFQLLAIGIRTALADPVMRAEYEAWKREKKRSVAEARTGGETDE